MAWREEAAFGNVNVEGTLEVAGAITATAGVSTAASAVTAAAAGADITATGARTFVTVTSANAAHWVTLPSPTVGQEIWLKNGATGYEIRSNSPSFVSINGGTGADAEAAVIANQLVRLVAVSATAWIATNFHTDGTVSALTAAA